MLAFLIIAGGGHLLAQEEDEPRIYAHTYGERFMDSLADKAVMGNIHALERFIEFIDDDSLYTQHCGEHGCRYLNTVGLRARRYLAMRIPFIVPLIHLYPERGDLIIQELKKNLPRLYFDSVSAWFVRHDSELKAPPFITLPLPDSVVAHFRKVHYGFSAGYYTEDFYRDRAMADTYNKWKKHLDSTKDHRLIGEIAKSVREKRQYAEAIADQYATNNIYMLTGTMIVRPAGMHTDRYLMYFGNEDFFDFWKVNYRNYTWDSSSRLFTIPGVLYRKPPISELLNGIGSNEAISKTKFISLTESDPMAIAYYMLVKWIYKDSMDAIPRAVVSAQELAAVTAFCRSNNISYQLRPEFETILAGLESTSLTIGQRTNLENKLFESTGYNDLMPLEYWLFAENWDRYYKEHGTLLNVANTSVGRVICRLYTANWDKIISDDKQLGLYLLKSGIFEELADYGKNRYQDYDRIISDNDPGTRERLKRIYTETGNESIKHMAAQILLAQYKKTLFPHKRERHEYWYNKPKKWRSFNSGYMGTVKNITSKLEHNHGSKSKKSCDEIIMRATYSQAGEVGEFCHDKHFCEFSKLLQVHLGIPIDTIRNENDVKEFLAVYNSRTETELYKYYLQKAGYTCWDSTGRLQFGKVYDILRHNPVHVFDDMDATVVFAVVHLLEDHFHTALGYPPVSSWSYGSLVMDDFLPGRVGDWIDYLVTNKYVPAYPPGSLYPHGLYCTD